VAIGLCLAGAVLWYFGPALLARVAEHLATQCMATGALGPAQQWLARAERMTPDDYRVDLLRAACLRQLRQEKGWAEALETAQRKGAPAEAVALEREIGRVLAGEVDDPGAVAERLVRLGIAPHDAAAAVLDGLLARGRRDAARTFLESGLQWVLDEPQRDYLWGVYLRRAENATEAEARLARTLRRAAEHEPARAELAAMLEEQGRFEEALAHYVELANRSLGTSAPAEGLARVLYDLGRFRDARRVLDPLVSRPEPLPAAAVQMASVEAALGHYAEALGWFNRLGLEDATDARLLTAAARTFALAGQPRIAERLFERIAMMSDRALDQYRYRVRLDADPNDVEAAVQLRRLAAIPMPRTDLASGAAPPEGGGPASAAADLYARHCAACHGTTGDGRGRAARHLFPRPRNLRTGAVQLVSTRNGVPTREDLESLLLRALPGASMPSFEQLSQAERSQLVDEMIRLRRQGEQDRIVEELRKAGEEIDEDEVRQAVQRCTTPGETIRPPSFGSPTGASLGRGRSAYLALGCDKCHGDDGRGDPQWLRYDAQGNPVRARDLVAEPFKGGRTPESIFLRIVAGMPGTDHPSAASVSEADLIDLVHYVGSLARGPQRRLTNHQRWTLAMPEAYRAEAADGRPQDTR
jgi:tetratricopeptide (TPR) repeat protein